MAVIIFIDDGCLFFKNFFASKSAVMGLMFEM